MMKDDNKIEKTKVKSGILKQVQFPLICFLLAILALTTFLGAWLILSLASFENRVQLNNQAQMAALRVEEYKAAPELLDYWFEHRGDLKPVYDDITLDNMEREFKTIHPEHAILRDVTGKAFSELDEESRRLFATICLGRLSSVFDEIKRTFDPEWLFCFVIKGDTIYYMVTGTKGIERRISQGGDLFELGSESVVDRSEYSDLFDLYENYDLIKKDINVPYTDTDRKLNSTGAWVPVVSERDELLAVVGASRNNYALVTHGIRSVTILVVGMIIAFMGMELWIVRLLVKRVVRPITAEEATIRSYMETKDSTQTVSELERINSHNEIEVLADSFSQMVEEVDRYVNDIRRFAAETERIGAELDLANQIQANMLPDELYGYEGERDFTISAYMKPAREVGGDFYDYYMIDDDHIGLCIADVSGKGMGAAMFMAICMTVIRSTAKDHVSPAETIEIVNSRLCERNTRMIFVTVWFGIYTISTHEITYVNAGHEYPAVYRAGKKAYELIVEEHDLVLGFDPDVTFTEHTISLSAGDRLFVYTDGIPEATSNEDELFGNDRMLASLNATAGMSGNDTFESLRRDIEQFVDGAEQFDDITMLCFDYRGNI